MGTDPVYHNFGAHEALLKTSYAIFIPLAQRPVELQWHLCLFCSPKLKDGVRLSLLVNQPGDRSYSYPVVYGALPTMNSIYGAPQLRITPWSMRAWFAGTVDTGISTAKKHCSLEGRVVYIFDITRPTVI